MNTLEKKNEVVYRQEIKEIELRLQILEGNLAMGKTKKINGTLKGIIIDSDKQVDIRISLVNFPKIEILNEMQHTGCHYVPLKITPVSKSAKQFNFSSQEWVLNDMLLFEIKGQNGATATFNLRYV
jgi:hypothetical protein